MPTSARPYRKPNGPHRRISAELTAFRAADEAPLPFPLVLQRRASRTMRGHVLRGVVRVATLLVADMLTLGTVRELFRGVSTQGWLGESAALGARFMVPRGPYPFMQLCVAVFLGLALAGAYRSGDQRRAVRPLLFGAMLGVALPSWVRLWTEFTWIRMTGVLLTVAGVALSLVIARNVVELLVHAVRRRRGHPSRVLIVGRHADVQRAMGNAAIADPTEFSVVGFADIDPVPHGDALGRAEDVVDIIARKRIDTLLLVGSFDERQWMHMVHVADAAGCQALTLPGALMLEGFAPQLVMKQGVPLVEITRPALRGHHQVLKRILDLAVSGLGLLVLSPLLLALAVAVKATSRGPVFFRQTRVGRGGRYFEILKFRSMVVDAEARLAKLKAESVYADGRLFKMERDPRITRVGAFLRRTSLDELPQLWNVLVGDMSLVGPRPPIPNEVVLYDDHHYTRFDVKPGITGPWQVSGRNKIRDFEEVVRLETNYIRHWSIRKDLQILWRTVPAVLKMDGAY